jgi:hypothetical protein
MPGVPRPVLRVVAFALVALTASAAAMLRRSAELAAPAEAEVRLDVPPMPAQVAAPLAFGFRSLLADFTFLQSIQLLALRKADRLSLETLPLDRAMERLLTYAVEVDPKFGGAYRFAAAALPHETVDGKVMGAVAAAMLLEQGVRELPDQWRIGFLLGFIRGYYLGDYAGASKSMAQAARLPGSPRYLGLLATRLGAQGGELQLAVELAEGMLAQANEEQTRKQWEDRLKDLYMERDLRAIDAAVDRWHAEHGAPPPSIRALVASHFLQHDPVEPHGGRYVLDHGGHARSTAAERLMVYGGTARLEVH